MATSTYDGTVYIFGGTSPSGPSDGLYMLGRTLEVNGTTLSDDPSKSWRGVDWYPDGHEAIIVGDGGAIYRHTRGKDYCQPIENTVSAADFYAVGCKAPTSPGYALVMGLSGGGVRVNVDITAGSAVTLAVGSPHISYVHLQDSGGVTKTNQQIDVDAGSNATYYDLTTRVWHSTDQLLITQVDIYMWYDQGNVGNTADYPALMGAAFDNPGGENIRAHFQWNAVGQEWTQIYPAPTLNEETSLNTSFCSSTYDLVDKKNITLTFRFSPHQQFRNASGPFSEGPGTNYRYDGSLPVGWNPEDQSTVSALNDPWTWDIKVNASAGVDTAAAYDEFGVFKYTYMTSSGLPGDLSGSGPPNSIITLTPQGHVTFSANCEHRLQVYVDKDLKGQKTSQVISATKLWVQGGDFPGDWFFGIGSLNAKYILGDVATWRGPNDLGRISSTGIGSQGPITWQCNVPFTPEDTYTTTITYLLTHS